MDRASRSMHPRPRFGGFASSLALLAPFARPGDRIRASRGRLSPPSGFARRAAGTQGHPCDVVVAATASGAGNAAAAFEEPPDIDAYMFDGTAGQLITEEPDEDDVFDFAGDMGESAYH